MRRKADASPLEYKATPVAARRSITNYQSRMELGLCLSDCGAIRKSVQETSVTCSLKVARAANQMRVLSDGPVRLRQRHGLIVKGKRISCPPQYRYRDPAKRAGRLR